MSLTFLPENLDALDIRDIEMGAEWWVVLNPEGRCVMNGMFKAAWNTRKKAARAAKLLGEGHTPLKQIKQ